MTGSPSARLSAEVRETLRRVGELSQLTDLHCGWADTVDQYSPVFGLPLLEKLQIQGNFVQVPDAEVLRAQYAKLSRKLTLFGLIGGSQVMVRFS